MAPMPGLARRREAQTALRAMNTRLSDREAAACGLPTDAENGRRRLIHPMGFKAGATPIRLRRLAAPPIRAVLEKQAN